jgi:hypothetical protein
MTTLNKLRRLKERAGRRGRCPLAPPPGTKLVRKIIVVDEEGRPLRPEELEPDSPCEQCGEFHDGSITVIEQIVIVSPDEARGAAP